MLRLQILEENELILSDCRRGALVNDPRPIRRGGLPLDVMAGARVQDTRAIAKAQAPGPGLVLSKTPPWHSGGLDPRTIIQKETPTGRYIFQPSILEQAFSIANFCRCCLFRLPFLLLLPSLWSTPMHPSRSSSNVPFEVFPVQMMSASHILFLLLSG